MSLTGSGLDDISSPRSPRSPRTPRTPRTTASSSPQAWNDVVTLLRDTRLLPEIPLAGRPASTPRENHTNSSPKAIQRHATSATASAYNHRSGCKMTVRQSSPIPPLRWVTAAAAIPVVTSPVSSPLGGKRTTPFSYSDVSPRSTAYSLSVSPRDLPPLDSTGSPRGYLASQSVDWDPIAVRRRPSAPAIDVRYATLSPREPQLLSFFSDESLCKTFSSARPSKTGSKHRISAIPEYKRDGHHPHRSSYRLARLEQDEALPLPLPLE